jgi:hypothetical protein
MSSALEQLKASGTIVVADSGEIEKVSEHKGTKNAHILFFRPVPSF